MSPHSTMSAHIQQHLVISLYITYTYIYIYNLSITSSDIICERSGNRHKRNIGKDRISKYYSNVSLPNNRLFKKT